MENIFKFLTDILSDPAFLIGLIILIGLVVQRKAFSEVVKGTLKGILGFLIIGAGATVLIGSLNYFGQLFQESFGVNGVVPNNEAIVSLALGKYGQATAIIMILGMAVNIFIARFTVWKYIFLTGHHTLYMAALISAVLIAGGLHGWHLYAMGGLALGFAMTAFPALVHPYMREITGNDDIALGHFGSIGYWASARIGKLFGGNGRSKSTEEINFPKSFDFLRDSSVSISLTMMIFFIIMAVMSGSDFVRDTLGVNEHYILFAIKQSIMFAAGVLIILTGVRLILAEIIPAFKGFSDKLVPNAKPALDCPIVFPFAENAVVIGFLMSFLGGIVGMGVLIAAGGIIILPGVIPHFFTGATAGVFGNAVGGRRGAILGSFVNGLVITFLPIALIPVLGELGFANTTFSDTDFIGIGIIIGYAASYGTWFLTTLILLLVSIPFVYTIVGKLRKS